MFDAKTVTMHVDVSKSRVNSETSLASYECENGESLASYELVNSLSLQSESKENIITLT
jgi:hypothetical protein